MKRRAEAPSTEGFALELERAERRRVRLAFVCIVGLALLVRAVHLMQARAVPLFEFLIVDARQYDAWARRIAAGDWMGSETFYQAPLYPYFLGVLKVCFGDGLWPIRIVQAVLGAASCGFLFLAGRNFVSHRVGVVAGVLLALYPPAVFFDGLVQKASIGGFIVVLVIWLISLTQEKPHWTRFAGLGLAMGLLLLTREETLLLVPALLVWIVVRFRSLAWWKLVASFVAGAACVLLPVGWRNHHVGGEFLITTSQAGTNFWIGNRPGADGRYAPLRPGRSDTSFERKDAFELAEIEMGRKLTPGEVSDFWRDQAFAWISDEPGEWLKLVGRKLALLVNAYEVPDAEDQYYYERHEPVLRLLSYLLHLGVVLPLSAAGLVLGWSQRKDLGVLAFMLLVLCGGVVLFYVMGRYRYPIVPIAILFAALALVQGFAYARVRAWKKLVPAAGALLVVAVASNWPIYSRDSQLEMSYVNAGAALSQADRPEEALVQYRSALEIEPNTPETWSNMGLAHGRLGRLKEAVDCFARAVELRPDDPRYHMRLGSALYTAGDADRAVQELSRATELFPRDPEAWNNLRFIFVQRRDWQRAVDVARRGVAANPGDLGLSMNLAWILAACPDERWIAPAEAVVLARKCVVAAGPKDPVTRGVLGIALARAGQFEEARGLAQAALELAQAAGMQDLEAELRGQIELYSKGQAYVESGR